MKLLVTLIFEFMSAHISATLTKIVPYPSSKSTLDVVLQKGSYENVDIMVPGCFLKAPHVVIGTRSREFTLFYFLDNHAFKLDKIIQKGASKL